MASRLNAKGTQGNRLWTIVGTSLLLVAGGMVLFVCQGNEENEKSAAAIAFEPAGMDLGTFNIGAADASVPEKKSCTVRNTGKRPVVIERVFTSCPCVNSLSWTGGLLAPGGAQKIDFSILRASWGISGRVAQQIVFQCADGSQPVFEIVGICQRPRPTDKLTISPTTIRVKSSAGKQKMASERDVAISFDEGQVPKLHITSKVPWITAEIKEHDRTSALVRLRITPDRKELQSQSEIEGTVIFASRANGPAIPVRVTVFREPFFRFSPPLAVLRPGGRGEISLVPLEGRAKFVRLTKVWSETPGLTVDLVNHPDGKATINISCGKSVAPGFHLGSCLIQSDAGDEMLGSVALQVKK